MSRASVKAYRHLASVLAELGQTKPFPQPGSPWRQYPPPEFPARWASSWGEDEYGLWCGFEVQAVEQRMRWISPGLANIGSPDSELERVDNELQYQIQLEGFWMAESTCTQALWSAVVDDDPSHFKGGQLPVERVSWDDIQNRFFPKLMNIVPELDVRLPGESEWEYACRAGTRSPFWWGDKLSPDLANYDGNIPYAGGSKGEYRKSTLDSIKLYPNPWGLYQMHGNVWEWCDDLWRENPLQDSAEGGGGRRVVRGGSWLNDGRTLRSAMRNRDTAGARGDALGFRLVAGSRQAAEPQAQE